MPADISWLTRGLWSSPCLKSAKTLYVFSTTDIFSMLRTHCRPCCLSVCSSSGRTLRRISEQISSLSVVKPYSVKQQRLLCQMASATSLSKTEKLIHLSRNTHLITFAGVVPRSFSITSRTDSHLGMGVGGSNRDKDRNRTETEVDSALNQEFSGKRSVTDADVGDWGVRLANENGYLSWCRNTYLATVVAIAMLGEGTTALSVQAAECAFLVAGLNLTWGTYQFVYNVSRLRQKLAMSRLGALLYVSLAVVHFLLWFIACTVYMGYADDPDLKAIEEEARQQRQQEI